MKVRDLKDINLDKQNIFHVPYPYYWLGNFQGSSGPANWVIFLGSDFYNMNELGDEGRKEFIRLSNLCLDYIRRECSGLELYYKPHPAETNEHEQLNLASFRFMKENRVAEEFLWENACRIKHIFGTCSTALLASNSMGLNTHIFLKLFYPVYDQITLACLENYFKELPPDTFIESFQQTLGGCGITLTRDGDFEQNISSVLSRNKGQVWLIVSETKFILSIIALAKLIRKTSPTRKINLIISRHHRWNLVNLDRIRIHVDSIVIFHRVFYSLEPKKLIEAVVAAYKIRNFRINKEDVLIGFSPYEFIENCFISYYKSSFKIAFLDKAVFTLHCEPGKMDFLRDKNFRFSKASWFYNKLFEPVLGINRSLFLRYGTGTDHYLSRPQESINDIYDEVYLLQ